MWNGRGMSSIELHKDETRHVESHRRSVSARMGWVVSVSVRVGRIVSVSAQMGCGGGTPGEWSTVSLVLSEGLLE